MADRNDEIMSHLALTISMVYTLLVEVCEMLPVPIGLPIDRHIPAENAVPAIQRVTEVAQDQPMGELQGAQRSEEHTSELQSLMRISYAVFCLTNKHTRKTTDRCEHTPTTD